MLFFSDITICYGCYMISLVYKRKILWFNAVNLQRIFFGQAMESKRLHVPAFFFLMRGFAANGKVFHIRFYKIGKRRKT